MISSTRFGGGGGGRKVRIFQTLDIYTESFKIFHFSKILEGEAECM